MRKAIIFLAFLTLFTLSLPAAEPSVEPAPEPAANEELVETQVEVQAEADSHADFIDFGPFWAREQDNGASFGFSSCNAFECYLSCVAQYGEGVQSNCVGSIGNWCCICYP